MDKYDYSHYPGEVAQAFDQLSELHRQGDRDPVRLRALTELAVGNFVTGLKDLVIEEDLLASLRSWLDEIQNPSFGDDGMRY